MRFALSILGTEILALEYGPSSTPEEGALAEPEMGPPFGFSGGAGGQFDIAAPDPTPEYDPDNKGPR